MTSTAIPPAPAPTVEQCPVLLLQPILRVVEPRIAQHNFQQVVDWTRRLCQHLETIVVDGGSP